MAEDIKHIHVEQILNKRNTKISMAKHFVSKLLKTKYKENLCKLPELNNTFINKGKAIRMMGQSSSQMMQSKRKRHSTFQKLIEKNCILSKNILKERRRNQDVLK